MSRPHILYYSATCPNSVRILQSLSELPVLAKQFSLVDVARANPSDLRKIKLTHVPTIARTDGRMFVGAKCFELLAEHQSEKELDMLPASGFASGGTSYSLVDDFGSASHVGHMYCSLTDFGKPS